MDVEEALKVVEALAEGVNPETGELLPSESCFNSPRVIRAMYAAKEALSGSIRIAERISKRPAKAGRSWSEAEDQQLANSFDAGSSVDQLAEDHGRTKGAIAARLVRIGKIKERDQAYNTERNESET